jgi:hypothetical protein
MIGSAIIEVGIGLVLVFSLMSIVVTQVNNVIANLLNLRAESLRDGLERLITDETLRDEVLRHPMINVVRNQFSLKDRPTMWKNIGSILMQLVKLIFQPQLTKRSDTTTVTWVDPNAFANVMMNTLVKNPEVIARAAQLKDLPVAKFIELLKENIDDVNLERTLETLLATATTIEEAQQKMVMWFNNGMANLSDLFKRRLQYISFVVGLLLSMLLNVDTVNMALTFYNDPALREIAVNTAQIELAQERREQQNPGTLEASTAEVRRSVDHIFELRLPIGWTFETEDTLISNEVSQNDPDPRPNPRNIFNMIPNPAFDNTGEYIGFLFMKFVGWIVTALACMQGSDFWFNLLRQLTGQRQQQAQQSGTQ